MAWSDYQDPMGFEKFQVRSGNEPSAAQFAKDRSQSWMDAGYSSPSVTPYWQRPFTTEHSGISPGAGNTRTYQFPGGWGESTIPEYGGAYQKNPVGSNMGLKGIGSTGLKGIESLIENQFRNPEQEEAGYEKFQTRSGNEPEAFALQNQIAQDFMEGGYPYPSVTPYLQRGFTGEYPGISRGAGNTRTFQSPDQFSFSVTPNPNNTAPSFEDLMEMFGKGDIVGTPIKGAGSAMQKPGLGQAIQNPYEQYLGETMGPAGMNMPAYMDRPETQRIMPNISVEFLGDQEPKEEFFGGRSRMDPSIARLLRQMGYFDEFNEGGAVGLEPGIGSLMRGI